MVCCCVPFCKSDTRRKTAVSFHEFPVNHILNLKWLAAISRADFTPNDKSPSSKVCSKHFKEEDYIIHRTRRCLKHGVVPSIFPHYPQNCKSNTMQSTLISLKPRTVSVNQKHFTDDQFENNRLDCWRKLKPNAIPTIFCYTKKPEPKRPPLKHIESQSSCGAFSQEASMIIAAKNLMSNTSPISDSEEQHNSSSEQETVFPSVPHSGTEFIKLSELQKNFKKCQLKVEMLEEELKSTKRTLRKVLQDSELIENSFKELLNEDQINFLRVKTRHGFIWSQETVQKALRLRSTCGSLGYKVLREFGYPLPSERTLKYLICNHGDLYPVY